MNGEQVTDFGVGIGMVLFWGALLFLLLYFSFLSRGARKAAWQANVGMFCGFLGFLLFTGLLAIPLGHVARRRIKASAGSLTGKGRAAFALVVGYLATGYLVCTLSLFGFQRMVNNANLAAVDRAKLAWAAATGATNGALPTAHDLAPFCPGKKFPVPVGYQIYHINAIGMKASSRQDFGGPPPTTPRPPPWESP